MHQGFTQFLRIKTTCECIFLPLFTRGFRVLCGSGPSRQCTAQIRFSSRNTPLSFHQCALPLKTTGDIYLSSIFMMAFISTCIASAITGSSQLCWIGCLLWSLPPWHSVCHLWFLPKGGSLTFRRWHSPSIPYWWTRPIDRNPDVSPGSETEQQEILQATSQDQLKVPSHGI